MTFLLRNSQFSQKKVFNLHTIKINNCVAMDRKLNRIKTALVDNGKTNKWLAEQLGKDPATISKWCTNACQPSLEMLITISKLLRVDLNDLVRIEAVPDPIIKESSED